MRTFIRRAWHRSRRHRLEADLAEEMEFHRAMREQSLREDGLDADEATVAARRALGNVLLAQESARDVWISPWLQDLCQDLRFAVRLLFKDRAFTATTVLTLALGIGANTTIFSAVYAVLLKPLPFADADRLVAVLKITRRAAGCTIPSRQRSSWRGRLRGGPSTMWLPSDRRRVS